MGFEEYGACGGGGEGGLVKVKECSGSWGGGSRKWGPL